MKPVILFDIDGVALIWQTFAVEYCKQYNLPTYLAEKLQTSDEFINPFIVEGKPSPWHIANYNEQTHMANLMPYADAVEFINKNKDKYDFVAVTAMSGKGMHLDRRMENLKKYFGDAFVGIHGCGITESKEQIFKDARAVYGSRIVAYVDDMAHHLGTARIVFRGRIKLFHLIRDIRESGGVECTVVSKLTQIKLDEV